MPLENTYSTLIDQIVEQTLKGKIRSKAQVKTLIIRGLESGTGELFERCLSERIAAAETDISLKASRILRALQTIQGEWEHLQQERASADGLAQAMTALLAATPEQKPQVFLQLVDPNQPHSLTNESLRQLAQQLRASEDGQAIARGIETGLSDFDSLEGELVSWLYQPIRGALGFGGESQGPWALWGKRIVSPLPRQLFTVLAEEGSIVSFTQTLQSLELSGWVQLVVLLQSLQRSLVTWFDQQPYDSKAGRRLSYSTFLIFAHIWCQLWQGWTAQRGDLANGSFQMMLQILRRFAQREDFPLYGGIFASFNGDYLKETLTYFSDPLQRVEATREKARLLTLLGYSQRTLGRYDPAIAFHEEALQIARDSQDAACEVANLNHLARVYVLKEEYQQAINLSQRALIAARQQGDRLAEANALVNLGYSEVFAARAAERMDSESIERAIRYLEQGLALAEKQGDRQSQALAYNSLGIAYTISAQPGAAVTVLEKGLPIAQISGNAYLQGLNATYLAEAYYALQNLTKAIHYACLGMYWLEQMGAQAWRQAAGLIAILQGQLGETGFNQAIAQQRTEFVRLIGVDGFEHLPQLWQRYRESS
ncbi:MAG: tetratricopeptide repeat protein [Leptolyngbyaceae cyanobacterium SL_1_1]|nr:tetratricopeptide repeat protein [Leptolyngbyaceae cyanobacterium RM1_1_2]NJO09917.1 tetratricopeptide repeat protein [Leptolyngbyaceae cyanobacterium SL_1_1]